jgi:hypothetical protein
MLRSSGLKKANTAIASPAATTLTPKGWLSTRLLLSALAAQKELHHEGEAAEVHCAHGILPVIQHGCIRQ